jgi:hypothetical protein
LIATKHQGKGMMEVKAPLFVIFSHEATWSVHQWLAKGWMNLALMTYISNGWVYRNDIIDVSSDNKKSPSCRNQDFDIA